MQSDFFLNGHEGVSFLVLATVAFSANSFLLRIKIPFRHYLIGITNPFFLKRVLSQGKDNTCISPHVVYLAGPEVKYVCCSCAVPEILLTVSDENTTIFIHLIRSEIFRITLSLMI